MAAVAALRSAARSLRAPPANFTAAAREGQRRLVSSSSSRTAIQGRNPLQQLGRLRAEKLALQKKNAELLRHARFQTMAAKWIFINSCIWFPLIFISGRSR
jgi:hypothetical protein